MLREKVFFHPFYEMTPFSSCLSFKLNTGESIPAVGLGTVSQTSSRDEIREAVLYALKIGYRHIDTASMYGSESGIGDALSEAFSSGLLRREDVFVTSKLWCEDNDSEDVLPALKRSLSLLQLDYLDLYLMHFPVRLKKGGNFPPKDDDVLSVDISGSWKAMEKCAGEKLIKAIGVSNFSVRKLEDLLQYARITPAVNQVEMHPVWQQRRLRDFCSSKGIHVSAWSPLGAPGAQYGTVEVLAQPQVVAVAGRHGKTPAQVALRWGIQSGVSVLPKSFNRSRLEENLQVFDWKLLEDDMKELETVKQWRTNTCSYFCNATSSSYKTPEDLWDEPLCY